MIKWVRVYVSLKLFKRGDLPIVFHELWHRNWNKEILSGPTLLSTCLMNEWVDDWHYFSSALRYIQHSFCIFPCTHLFACWRKLFWERRIGGGTCPVARSRQLVIRELNFFMISSSCTSFGLHFPFIFHSDWFSLVWQANRGTRLSHRVRWT